MSAYALALVACVAGCANVSEAPSISPADAPTNPPAQSLATPAPRHATGGEPLTAEPARVVYDWSLPTDWATLSATDFEQVLTVWTRAGVLSRLDDAGLNTLGRALAAADDTSVRAAVILGNTSSTRALDVLLSRLEARVPSGQRSSAGDVVAAAACAALAPTTSAAERLEALAAGTRPHPVLEVRCECAFAALTAGRDGAASFLLDLLREGTSAALRNPSWPRRDWNDARLQRLQERAAHALSTRAGSECTYRVHAPLAVREREIQRLAQWFGAPAGGK